MAPKKKRTCTRPSYDQSRFLSEDGQIAYMHKFQHHSVVPERIVMYNELNDLDFADWMREREWWTLYDLGYQIVVNWVKEFYSNMHELSNTSFKTFVRGQKLEITPDLLSQVLEINHVEGVHFSIEGNRRINYNTVAKKIIGRPIAWIGCDMSQNKVSDSYRLLNIFIHHNVSPKVSKKVTKEDGYLRYYIGTQRKVDIPLAVFRGMAKVQTAPHNTALPFPGIVSKILQDMSQLPESNEDIIIPMQKIDRFTLDKSRSHIPTVELDGDVKGDLDRPSGANHPRIGQSVAGDSDAGISGDEHIDEGTIHVLNQRLTRLEMRVNEGFDEMRQSFTELLDRLHRY